MAKQEMQVICKSVFKSGENTIKIQFTHKWIELINRIERNGQIIPVKR
ncbi:MAG: hypothetical protein K0R19_1780 [Bacillota bacterium]|jgi:hypothetical protein|nr:hypothetical protein [Bacillota bacterium]